MITWEELQDIIMEISAHALEREQIQKDTCLIEDLQYDSLAVMELLAELELRFGVDYTEFPDFDERFDCCQDLFDGMKELMEDRRMST